MPRSGSVGVKVISDVFSLPLETSVIINFTAPQATAALLDGLGPRKTALVIGTTGMTAPKSISQEGLGCLSGCFQSEYEFGR